MSSFPQPYRRTDSGELGVFEATRYFSSGVDASHEICLQRAVKMERPSLDMPLEARLPHRYTRSVIEMNQMKEKIKCKQPSSPASRLANFINSLFQQHSNSSKHKKPSKSLKGEDDQESRRRRSSSISHSQSIRSSDNKPFYYSTSGCSGFRTPSFYSSKREVRNGRMSDAFVEKNLELNVGVWDDELKGNKGKGVKREEDDSAESDSSSDLFELKNYDLGHLPSELPVYGSTDIEVIKRGAANIANVAF